MKNKTAFAIILICMVVMLLLSVSELESFIADFRKLTLNEKGDTIGGFFGSLAFIAAVVAVIFQSQELRAQRTELELTRKEMIEQRKASQEMAVAMKTQSEILTREQEIREADIIWEIVHEKLQLLVYRIEAIPSESNKWFVCMTPPESVSGRAKTDFLKKYGHETLLFEEVDSQLPPLQKLARWSRASHFSMQRIKQSFEQPREEGPNIRKPRRYTGYYDIANDLIEINAYVDLLKEENYRTRLQGLGLETLLNSISNVLSMDNAWSSGPEIVAP
jgi:hypothetical protein